MADSKISALSDGSPLVSTDLLVIARGGSNYKLAASEIKQFLASDKKTRSSGDITGWTATAFTVLDTGLNITLTTGARRCLVTWTLMATNTSNSQQQVDVELDGSRLGQTFGLVFMGGLTANANANLSGSVITAALAAGSHTFKLMFRVDGNTSKIYASTSIAPIVFSVVELAT